MREYCFGPDSRHKLRLYLQDRDTVVLAYYRSYAGRSNRRLLGFLSDAIPPSSSAGALFHPAQEALKTGFRAARLVRAGPWPL